jgi:hypothetical protein
VSDAAAVSMVVVMCRSSFVLCTVYPVTSLEGEEWLARTLRSAGACYIAASWRLQCVDVPGFSSAGFVPRTSLLVRRDIRRGAEGEFEAPHNPARDYVRRGPCWWRRQTC